MNFDTFSTAAMAAELRSILLGGRVQRVVQINSLTFGFEIYIYPTRYYLLFSAEPQIPRLHLTNQKIRRGVGNDTPLMLVLRKYMRGAILKAIEQPPYERILHFHFESSMTATVFVAELLGTRSNLVLLEPHGSILGVARLPKHRQEGSRLLLPNQPYQPPAAQLKLKPEELTELSLRQELSEASPQLGLVRLLTNIVSGVSPLLAREIVYRATGHIETTVEQMSRLTPLLNAFHELFDHLRQDQWQPSLALDEEGGLVAFAPYPLRHLPQIQVVDSFSQAVETYFADAASGYEAAKAPLQTAIDEVRQRLARRRERLEEDAAMQSNPTLLKDKGEAILAHTYQIEPGQKELVVDWVGYEALLKIELDPALSPSDNAQQYFNRYRKGQRASDEIPAQLEKIGIEGQYLEQLEQDLAMAENRPEIDAIAVALAEAGYHRSKRNQKKRQKQVQSGYLRLIAPDGAVVWAGKNALQNAHLTFERAGSEDIWLHARDAPGAHVIIPTAQGLPSEADVFWAAGVAAYYSRARNDTSVEVDVTLKKYVRPIKGSAPGLVTYRNESTFRVVPEAPEVEGDW